MGEREFAIATAVLCATGHLGAMRVTTGLGCIAMGLLSAVEQFEPVQPWGPHGALARTVHLLVLLSAILVGAGWLLTPWPGHRRAVAFVAWGDVALALSAALLADPQARLSATVYMCLVGVFVAVLLGYRILLVHCAFATATIAALTWWGVHYDGATVGELTLYFAPALATVVAMPVIAAMVVEGTRQSLDATARAANRDPLTGLLNRRGFDAATDLMRTRLHDGSVVVLAVVDLDRFKQVNDERGHGTGDAALRDVGEQLSGVIRAGDIAARTGGDEFVVVASLDSQAEVDAFVDSVRGLRLYGGDEGSLSASIGIAWMTCGGPDVEFDAILARADEAMYRAKRLGGGTVVVLEPPPVMRR